MLALMPHSPPLHIQSPVMASTTMSLAILPSAPASLAYSQTSAPMPLPSTPSPSKRPRLSLNTTNVQPSILGKGATSLRLETLSATSPTARNTFQNAHNDHAPRRSASPPQQKPTLARIATDISWQAPSDDTDTPDDSVSSSTTTASNSTAASATEVPYKLSYNITSILSNGPIPKPLRARISFRNARPMFPSAKKVCFRTPLTEDINNTKYTMKHSDIESSTSTISTLELSPPEAKSSSSPSKPNEKVEHGRKSEEGRNGSTSPKTGEKRDSSDEEDDGDTCPVTPIAGRRKRHRQWVWTLGSSLRTEQRSDECDSNLEQKA